MLHLTHLHWYRVEMLDKAYWKKVWLERWLPNIPPALAAVLASTLLAPMVHEYFVQKENMNNARFAFYTRFINNFGELRKASRTLTLQCKSGRPQKTSEITLNIQNKFENLFNDAYDAKNYFGPDAAKSIVKFSAWFSGTSFECSNSHENDVKLFNWEHELWQKLYPQIFGNG